MAHTRRNRNFPSQVVSDAEKLSYDYGLKVAKAIESEWFQNDRQSNRFRTYKNNFHNLRLYARGEQSIQKYKDELSINGDLSYLNLDWKPVPIIPKFVDIVVNGIAERTYDIKVHALDNYATYYDLNSLNTYSSCTMIYATAPDLSGTKRTMILVVIPVHGNGDNEDSSNFKIRLAYKWNQGIRPLRLGSTEQARRMFYNEKLTGKNLCHGLLHKGNTYDVYCPIMWGSSKDNDNQMVLHYRRSQWPTMSTSAAGPTDLHYLFDKFIKET